MPSAFPNALDSFTTTHADNVGEVIHASDVNNLADAVNKIEIEVRGGFVANAKHYGATGNGSTDDTAAIQAAITAATGTGGTVYLPPGTYLCGTINLAANVALQGAGMGATTVKLKNAANANLLDGSSKANIRVADLTLDGNRANQTVSTNCACIQLMLCDYAVLERVRVTGGRQFGVVFGGSRYGALLACRLDDCGTSTASGDGFGWFGNNGATYSDHFLLQGCVMVGRAGGPEGFTITSTGGSIVSCRILGNDTHQDASGFYVGANVRGLRFQNNYVENCGNYGIDLDFANADPTYGVVITGNTIVGCRNAGIGCASNGAVIVGNQCRNNGRTINATAPDAGAGHGILVDAANVVLVGNRCTDTQGTKTQQYGIGLRNNSTVTGKLTLVGNDLEGNVNAGVYQVNAFAGGQLVGFNRGQVDAWANVRHYGATGNGTTDDSAAFVAALAASDHVFVPPGTYAIASSVNVGSNKTVRGAGIGATTLKRTANFAAGVLNANGNSNVTVEHLTFDGNYPTISTTTVDELDLNGTDNVARYCEVKAFSKYGILAQGTRPQVVGCRITGVNSATVGSEMGIVASGAGALIRGCTIRDVRLNAVIVQGANVRVQGNYFRNNHPSTGPGGGHVLTDTGGNDALIEDNVIVVRGGNETYGIELNASGAVVQGNTIDGQWMGINVLPGATNTVVQGNVSKNNSRTGIFVSNGATGFQIVGNRCFDNQGTPTQLYGIEIEAGASNNYVVLGNDLRGNTTAGFSNGATGTTRSVASNLAHATAAGGTSTQTPGAVSTVNIAHGLAAAPTTAVVQPANANARGAPAYFVTFDATNVVLTFASNLTAATSYAWNWRAERF